MCVWNIYGATLAVEKKGILEGKPVTLVICLTQIQHGVAWDLTRATASLR